MEPIQHYEDAIEMVQRRIRGLGRLSSRVVTRIERFQNESPCVVPFMIFGGFALTFIDLGVQMLCRSMTQNMQGRVTLLDFYDCNSRSGKGELLGLCIISSGLVLLFCRILRMR
jgi:hypothetical protein